MLFKYPFTKTLQILCWVTIGFVLTACQSIHTTGTGTLGIDRKQKMSISAEHINQESAQSYAQLLQEARQKRVLNTDPALLARVRKIAARLIPQTAIFRNDAPSWTWEVNTIQSPEINAFCMAGGKIIVYSGLVNTLKLTDDELAAVMGHEIAHALREHVREQASEQQGMQLLAVLAGLATKSDAVTQGTSRVLQLYGLKHSRQAESEADLMGLELAARAGYNPNASISLWNKMEAANGSAGVLEFISTHPNPENRRASLSQAAEKVMPIYQSAQSTFTSNAAPAGNHASQKSKKRHR